MATKDVITTLMVGAIGGVALTLLLQKFGRQAAKGADGGSGGAKKGPGGAAGKPKGPGAPPKKNKRKPCQGSFLSEEYGFRYNLTGGVVYPPWSDDQEEAIQGLMKLDWLQPGDIVVATYPKAGTTLMQQIIMLLLNGGDSEKVGDVMVTSPWVEREYCTSLDREAGFDEIQSYTTGEGGKRRVFKTHAPFNLFPAASIPDGVKVVCVVRDPRDVAVSMHKHYQGIPRFKYTGPMNHFLGLFCEGKVGHGCFFDHLSSWWEGYKKVGVDKMMWIKYEDLVGNKQETVSKVAAFVGAPDDTSLFEKVCSESDIDVMRTKAEAKAKKGGTFGSATHFNKGVSGTWKKKLTVAEGEALTAHCASKLEPMKDVELSFEA